MKHLFVNDNAEGVEAEGSEDGDHSAASETSIEVPEESSVPDQYLTLELEDKLTILRFLCDLIMGSRVIRSYIDECDALVTEYRKEKADLNRFRRNLYVVITNNMVIT